ncbi:hypothetical protein CHUAL_000717 [Chamberlinius hualienensis]
MNVNAYFGLNSDLQGFKILCKDWGNLNGDLVIGLHGWLDNCGTFDLLAPLLPLSKVRFIALDFPGHGHSSYLPPGRWYNWTDYLGSIIRTVDHLKVDKFSLLAHSMGGKMAFLYAGTYPEKVKRLVALDIFRPFPGFGQSLIESQEGGHNDWNYTKIYKSWFDHLMKLENVSHSKSATEGLPMEDLIKKKVQIGSGINFMPESVRILLKRGTRLVNKDPPLYVLSADPRSRIYDSYLHDTIADQFCKNMKCDLLLIMAEKGLLTRKEWGNPNGDPVIGLHGWVDNSATFDRLAPLLPLSKLRFIALDFPGHGLSSHIPPGRWYQWTDYLGSVIRIVSHLKLDTFSFLTHSMGGKIAILYAGIYPEKVKRMVVLDMHRPFPGGNRVLIEHQEGHHYSWDYTNIYKSYFDYLVQSENAKPTEGRPMEELVNRMLKYTNDLNFMTADSARILLKRGARLVSKDPDLYVLTRDSRLRVYDCIIQDDIVFQFCSKMKCDLLVVAPENGIIHAISPDYAKTFEIYKKYLPLFKMENVKGFHHEHLNNPNQLAPIVSKFLLTSQ